MSSEAQNLSLDGYKDLPAGKIASVVTYLEMRSRPKLDWSTSDGRFALQRQDRPNLGAYRDLFRRVGEHWLWFSRLAMPDAELRRTLDQSQVYYLVSKGRPKGLLELDAREPGQIELTFLGIVPELIGKGAGKFLLANASDLAWAQNPGRFCVHTCSLDHPRALGLYIAAGFVPYKRAIEVAEDPRGTGKLPRSAAPQVPIL